MDTNLKRLLSYGFWGVMTVLFSLISYWFLSLFFSYQIANLISIILTKIFAYFTNKTFVFKTITTLSEQIWEILRFIIARGFTGIVDLLGQIFLVEILSIDDFFSKCIMIIITTVLNYFLCSFGVFKNAGHDN